MSELAGRTAVVTGASSGIGREIARKLAAEGAHAVLVARRKPELEALAAEIVAAGGAATVRPADLSCIDEVHSLCDELRGGLAVDILVNNAGFGSHGEFHTIDGAREEAMVLVNVLALTELARAVIPGMIARRWGRILAVASTAGFAPVPYMATYAATKAYVLHHALALREELRPYGIGVTCLAPGPTRTEFGKAAGYRGSAPFALTAERVARVGVRGMMRGKAIVAPGLAATAVPILARLATRPFVARASASLMRRLGRA